jgi:tartrate-resistant acid phosphatase type 5
MAVTCIGIRIRLKVLSSIIALMLIALASGAYWLLHVPAVYLAPDAQGAARVSFLAVGDQGKGNLTQRRVARAMDAELRRTGDIAFALLLGDNFYFDGVGDTRDWQWRWKFEAVYDGVYFRGLPFYAVLGNHDYRGNVQAQIAYSNQRLGSNRFRMPAHQYWRDFGDVNGQPLLRVLFLDSNEEETARADSAVWLAKGFADGKQPLWRVVAAHHPLRNFGRYGDDEALLGSWLPMMQAAHIDLYLAGHDHNQQVITLAGEPWYVICGAGGGTLYRIRRDEPGLRHAREGHGFIRVDADTQQLQLTLFDDRGDVTARYVRARDCGADTTVCVKASPQDDRPGAGTEVGRADVRRPPTHHRSHPRTHAG